MENTLLVALSRQMSLERQIDIIANNVANTNTNGFKASKSLFEEYLNTGAHETTSRSATAASASFRIAPLITISLRPEREDRQPARRRHRRQGIYRSPDSAGRTLHP